MPRVVAHRGDSKHYPENTLSAFISAAKMGVDVIETDVHLSKDGVLVIWHDPTLERNTDGQGAIEQHSLFELKKLDAGYTFTMDKGKTFPFRNKGVELCTLEEAFQACPGQRFNVDLKSKNPKIVDAFIKVVRENHFQDKVIGASFHLGNLKELRLKAPEILTSLSTLEVLPLLIRQKLGSLPKAKGRLIFQVPISQWHIQITTPKFIRMMHQCGAVIQVWTINNEETMRMLFGMGVDAVMTDDPALAIKVTKGMGMRKEKTK
ncbi:MAG: glycerophosphodiester phosphodiesterase [Sphaerochaetaceae bacterium]